MLLLLLIRLGVLYGFYGTCVFNSNDVIATQNQQLLYIVTARLCFVCVCVCVCVHACVSVAVLHTETRKAIALLAVNLHLSGMRH